jgi:hypothetical protein
MYILFEILPVFVQSPVEMIPETTHALLLGVEYFNILESFVYGYEEIMAI